MPNKPRPHVLVHGRTTGNINVPVQVDAAGIVQMNSTGGGGGGTTATAIAPATASVGASSGLAVAANASRKYVDLMNLHDTIIIYLAFGANPAVVGSGIPLFPNAVGRFQTVQAINAITSGSTANLSVQEWQ